MATEAGYSELIEFMLNEQDLGDLPDDLRDRVLRAWGQSRLRAGLIVEGEETSVRSFVEKLKAINEAFEVPE